ncbi:hypothetical protein HKX48_007845 [Thoreauomyces humboldtii]|nr:hypothetical protein HKX48_007845 [Thoreauomyces humboldtii]
MASFPEPCSYMDPSEVAFTTGIVSSVFDDGRSVQELADDLENGRVSIEQVPRMRVARVERVYFALDNRRLWAVRSAKLSVVPVAIVDLNSRALDLTSVLPRDQLPGLATDPIHHDRQGTILADEICTWTPRQLRSDASPYAQCRAIDHVWASADAYFLAFLEPLLDKVYSGLQTAIGCVQDFVSVDSVSWAGATTSITCPGESKAMAIPRVHSGDALLLTFNGIEAIGYVKEVNFISPTEAKAWRSTHGDENPPPQRFTVKTSAKPDMEDVEEARLTFRFRVIDSVGPYSRIYQTIVRMKPSLDLLPPFIKLIIDPTVAIDYGRLNRPVYALMDPVEARISIEELLRWTGDRLNDSQMDAVLGSVSSRCPVTLISGPPGTGKTSVIVAVILTLLRAGKLVLQTAATNLAVAELAQRVMRQLPQVSGMEISRLVLTGHSERLNLDNTGLRRIHLYSRVERLQTAYADLPLKLTQLHTAATLRLSIESVRDLLDDEDQPGFVIMQVQTRPTRAQHEAHQNACAVLEKSLDSWTTEATRVLQVANSFMEDAPPTSCHVMKAAVGDVIAEIDAVSSAIKVLFWSVAEQIGNSGQISHDIKPVIRKTIEHMSNLWVAIGPVRAFKPETAQRIFWSDMILAEAAAVFCTLSVASTNLMQKPVLGQRVVIVDEAGQAPEAATLPLMTRSTLRFVLVGDAKQLPSVVNGKGALHAGFGMSLFERLEGLNFPKFHLAVQYRMHPEISAFPREEFYNGAITDGDLVKDPFYHRPWSLDPDFPPCLFINFFQKGELRDEATLSIYNAVEAEIVRKLLQDLFKYFAEHDGTVTVGIVSGYAAQVETIAAKIGNMHGCKPVGESEQGAAFVCKNGEIDVGSVDSFQGGRAKFTQIIIGDWETFRRSELWGSLLENLDSRGLTCDLHTHPRFSKYVSLAQAQKAIIEQASVTHVRAQGGFVLPALSETMPWTMQISEAALNALKSEACRTDANLLNRIFQLQSGNWKKGSMSPVPHSLVLKRMNSGNWSVIWSIALETKEDHYLQLVQIWGVVHVSLAEKEMTRVRNVSSRWTAELTHHCTSVDKSTTNKGWYVPKAFPRTPDQRLQFYRSASDFETGTEEATQNIIEDPIPYFKLYPFTRDYMSMLSDGGLDSAQLPFTMNPDETAVLQSNLGFFLLGRSGTGKTTVMLHRMYLIETQYRDQATEDGTFELPRQLMLTVSPRLSDAMSELYQKAAPIVVLIVDIATSVGKLGSSSPSPWTACEPKWTTKSLDTSPHAPPPAHPVSDESRDHELCHELKSLYVATTRAKSRLWFYDDLEERRDVLVDFLGRSNAAIAYSTAEELAKDGGKLATKSSKEEWNARGSDFATKGMWSNALTAYRNARNADLVDLCTGHILKEEALAARQGTMDAKTRGKIAKDKYKEAAGIFHKIRRYGDAGECWFEAGQYAKAAEDFVQAVQYENAFRTCIKVELDKKCLELAPDADCPPDVVDGFLRVFATVFHRRGEATRVNDFVTCMLMEESQRTFFKRYGYLNELLELDKAQHRYEDVAETYLTKKSWYQAVEFFGKAGMPQKADRTVLTVARSQSFLSKWGKPDTAGKVSEDIKRILELLLPDAPEGLQTVDLECQVLDVCLNPTTTSRTLDRAAWQTSTDPQLLVMYHLDELSRIATRPLGRDRWEACSRTFLDLLSHVEGITRNLAAFKNTDRLDPACERLFGLEPHPSNPDLRAVFEAVHRKLLDAAGAGAVTTKTSEEIAVATFARTGAAYLTRFFRQTAASVRNAFAENFESAMVPFADFEEGHDQIITNARRALMDKYTETNVALVMRYLDVAKACHKARFLSDEEYVQIISKWLLAEVV